FEDQQSTTHKGEVCLDQELVAASISTQELELFEVHSKLQEWFLGVRLEGREEGLEESRGSEYQQGGAIKIGRSREGVCLNDSGKIVEYWESLEGV
ncbi:hypothetical protein GOP47_0029480, partial [Adiantum capillus-veneris]